jgi:tetratricopeptide (TPR) repeat protein
VALAQPASRDPRREAAIEQQLETVAPAAVDAFRAATAALDSGRCAEAVVLFQQVIGQAPRFSPALRRNGGCLVDLGKRDEGLAYLESALAIERTVENLAALASSLFWSNGRGTPSWSDAERALPIAREALRQNQDENDPSYAMLVAQIAFFLNRLDEARAAANDLMTRFPDEAMTRYFAAILAAVDGDWLRAEREMREAGRRGLPPEVVEQFLDSGVRRGARLQRASWWTAGLVAAWAAGLLFLYVAKHTSFDRIAEFRR